eukprot:m.349923 g.349923  ORF g.349923 m.349923 type:complete len:396 (-) comp20690_c0_seq3:1406-2593(-)
MVVVLGVGVLQQVHDADLVLARGVGLAPVHLALQIQLQQRVVHLRRRVWLCRHHVLEEPQQRRDLVDKRVDKLFGAGLVGEPAFHGAGDGVARAETHQQIGRRLGHLVDQLFAIGLEVLLGLGKRQRRDVVERRLVLPHVLQLDLQVPVVLLKLLGEKHGVCKIPSVATDFDGRFEVEIEMFVRHDEFVQHLLVLQLGVAVEQQRRVVLVRQLLVVQRFQVRRKIVDALRIEKLANDIRGLQRPYCLDVLCNGIVVVAFGVQVLGISVPPRRHTIHVRVHVNRHNSNGTSSRTTRATVCTTPMLLPTSVGTPRRACNMIAELLLAHGSDTGSAHYTALFHTGTRQAAGRVPWQHTVHFVDFHHGGWGRLRLGEADGDFVQVLAEEHVQLGLEILL